MKKIFRTTLLIISVACMGLSARAQETGSTIMLEMAPYRHYVNPAFEPITDGYLYLPAISRLSLYAGNNSLAMNDFIINKDGRTMWTFNPESGVDPMSAFRKNTLIRANASTAILGFGFRTKKDAYVHVNIDANVDAGVCLPRDLFGFALGGGMTDLAGVNTFNLTSLGAQAQAYLSLGVGYSKKANDRWTWGLKVKVLDGLAYVDMRNSDLRLTASQEQWTLQGAGSLAIAAPLTSYPTSPEFSAIRDWAQDPSALINTSDIASLIAPSGLGAALDLGFTYQPEKHVKLSLSLTDLGGIYWLHGQRMAYEVDGTFDGVGTINYADYTTADGEFDSNRLSDTITARLTDVYANAFHAKADDPNRVDGQYKEGFGSLLTMKLNAGLDAYVADNKIGLGLYSRTMLYHGRIYEEVTLGAALRPTSWFNLGVSYSFLNGRWDNLGASLGLRGGPFALTLAADYVPLTYAQGSANGKPYAVPYKAQGLNFEMGLAVVWGWRHKAKKDNTLDELTPLETTLPQE